MNKNPIAIDTKEIHAIKTSAHPGPFASMMKGREKCRICCSGAILILRAEETGRV